MGVLEEKKKAKKLKSVSYNHWGYIFILPFFITFAIFSLYPMIYSVNLSFTNLAGWARDYEYVGLYNFRWVWGRELFWRSIGNTLIMWLLNFIPQIFFALFFAAVFTSISIKMKGKGLFKALFYFPNLLTAVTVAVLFGTLFAPHGTFHQLLVSTNIISSDFEIARHVWATRSIISYIQFFMWFGSTMILLIAAINSISDSVYEAALIDGSGKIRTFFFITLPLIKPIMVFVLITAAVSGLQMFDVPLLFAGGGPSDNTTTVAMYIYRLAFEGQRNYNMAAAASVYVMFLAVGMSIAIRGLIKLTELKD